jgi:hypothetical protein
MASPLRGNTPSLWKPFKELGYRILSVLFLSGAVYLSIGLLLGIEFLKSYGHAISVFRFWIVVVLMGLGGLGTVLQVFGQFRAINTSEKVAAAIGDIKDKIPGKSISEITSEDVAASIKGAKVGKKTLDQLVEQHKQQLLIDDDYFREELGSLIVDYLQPLPRNVKRLLNRFRVNLLIAHGRGLFTTEPKVTTQQLGKWLVLMERWPQLGRALSAAPGRMRTLEETSEYPAPTQSRVGQQVDLFMNLVQILAPFYVGDEDLRKFIHSEPSLATVVARLAHFGTDEAMASDTAKAAV